MRVEHGEGIRDALGHVGSLLHEGRANSGGAQSPLGWVGRFLHFSEIPQGALTEAVAVEFTQPSHRDDPQRDNVPRGFCYSIRSEWGSSLLNGLPRLVECGCNYADLFGIEHAGMGVYLNKTVCPPGRKFSCWHWTILTDMGRIPAFHCWTRAVLIAPAPTASTTQVFHP